MIKKLLLVIIRSNRVTSDLAACLYLRLRKISYLNDIGWFYSFNKSIPVDKSLNPIPWFTYPAIDFLATRITKEMSIFEFGSGNSTLWWATRVQQVVSCEHDKSWYQKMEALIPQNVNYKYLSINNEDYETEITLHHKKFDIVAIDGRYRVKCAKNSLTALKEDGVIIWDNSDREEYQEGYDFLRDHGFKRIDFTGIAPIMTLSSCTSVFYRQNNCLGI